MGLHSERAPKLEGKSKSERKGILIEEGIMKSRRFLLSFSSENRERYVLLRECIEELKAEYPTLVSATIGGSLVRGYANKESDLDIEFLFDTEKEGGAFEDINSRDSELGKKLCDKLREKLSKKLGISLGELGTVWMSSSPKWSDLSKSIKEGSANSMSSYFGFSLSKDILPYRRRILEELEASGASGEDLWKRIVINLWCDESFGFDEETVSERKKLYPWTIVEAKKYFLNENPDETGGNI